MTTKMLYRDLEILDLLKLRFIRDPDNKDVYVGRTTDEELDKYEEILRNTKKGTREMNANELAQQLSQMDTLQDGMSKFEYSIIQKSEAMLRQQQAEIEALKAKHDAISCSSCACGFIKRGKANEK